MPAAILFACAIASASRAGSALVCVETLAVLCLFAPRKARAVALARRGDGNRRSIVGWQGLAGRFQTPISEPLRADAVRASIEMVRDRPTVARAAPGRASTPVTPASTWACS